MGMGQSLLAILALAILGTIFLTSGRNTLDQRQVIEQCEYEIMATSLATSLVERASSLAFDEKTARLARCMQRAWKDGMIDEFSAIETKELLDLLALNIHEPAWSQALQRSFLSAFGKPYPLTAWAS